MQDLVQQHVRRRFDRAAGSFDSADYVFRHAFDGLMDRLEPVRIEPAVILDLGASTGSGSRALGKRFRRARIISGDISAAMLRRARASRRLFSRPREVQMDARRLPLRDDSVDLVVANMLLPWIDDLPACLGEVNRVLVTGGVFAFSTLGPGSLAPIRDTAGPHVRLHAFADMHDVGDALVRAGLADPVIDVDRLTITWPDAAAVRRDHVASGGGNSARGRIATLTGRDRLAALLDPFRRDGGLAAELELVYGHAWGTAPRTRDGEVRIQADGIGRRSRR
jgi:malonyl-CoA O-methyltransferase